MRIPYYMAIQNGGGVAEAVSLFFQRSDLSGSHSQPSKLPGVYY